MLLVSIIGPIIVSDNTAFKKKHLHTLPGSKCLIILYRKQAMQMHNLDCLHTIHIIVSMIIIRLREEVQSTASLGFAVVQFCTLRQQEKLLQPRILFQYTLHTEHTL